MGFIWFWLVAVMMVAYVVLDGFDLGVGILYPFLGRSEKDRQLMLRAIGPVWDGNEVWLIAGGGTLYFAFPLLYASAFSGFYLALMIVLWLLIMRGTSIELRMQIDSGVWRSFFDGLFFLSSSLLAIFFGAALANVIRGVPLAADGYFFLPLWTNWRVGDQPGILDWYTVIGGVVALVALAVHGALYLAVKTDGELQQRAREWIKGTWIALLAVTVVSLPATMIARPDSLVNYRAHPLAFIIPIVVLLTLYGMVHFCRRGFGRGVALDDVRNLVRAVKRSPNSIAGSGAIPCAFVSHLAVEGLPSFDCLQTIDQGKDSARVHRYISTADHFKHTQGVRHFLIPPLIAAYDRNSQGLDLGRVQ